MGSRVGVPYPLADEIRCVVSAVDNKLTKGSRYDWSEPILVAPGSHLVQLAATQGQLLAQAATRVDLQAGKTYTVRLAKEEANAPAKMWLEDQETGLPVGSKVSVAVPFLGL